MSDDGKGNKPKGPLKTGVVEPADEVLGDVLKQRQLDGHDWESSMHTRNLSGEISTEGEETLGPPTEEDEKKQQKIASRVPVQFDKKGQMVPQRMPSSARSIVTMVKALTGNGSDVLFFFGTP